MDEFKTEAVLTQEGTLTISGLPFHVGERVEVVVQPVSPPMGNSKHPLRGKPYRFERPLDPVAEEDWEGDP